MADHTTEQVVCSHDGTEIGYLQLGSGPALVMVHGAWGSRDAWLEVAKLLAERCSCYLMDRRGRGRSGDRADYCMDREIEDIEAVLEVAGPDASLLGHSSGAIYALEVARRVPVSRLVLYEPPLRWRGQRAESFLQRFRAEVNTGCLDRAATLFFREEARLEDDELSVLQSTPAWPQMTARARTCVREWEAILDAELQVERYRDVSVPTLLLAGTETAGHPSFATSQLEELLPHVRTTMLPGQGHMANHAVPDVVAGTVSRFLHAMNPWEPAGL